LNLRYKSALLLAASLAVASSVHAQQQGPSPHAGANPSPAPVASAAQPANPMSTMAAPQVQPTPQPQVPPLPANVAAGGLQAVPTKPGAGMSPEAFGELLNTEMPLSPKQVTKVRKVNDDNVKALHAHVGPAPTAVSTTARVTLAAGAEPKVIRLSVGSVTSMIFNDVTGAPWNVIKVTAGEEGLLSIQKPSDKPDSKSNMFTMSPTEDHVSTNIAVFLEGAPAPIMMIVATNQPEVDFRVDVSVQARGPGATMPAISRGLAESVSPELTSMVSGLTPTTARPLKIVSSDVADVQAWVIGDRMFVRSRAQVLAPPVPKDGKVATGADGTKVYELPQAPEVLLMQGGAVGHLRLEGFPPPTLTAAK